MHSHGKKPYATEHQVREFQHHSLDVHFICVYVNQGNEITIYC